MAEKEGLVMLTHHLCEIPLRGPHLQSLCSLRRTQGPVFRCAKDGGCAMHPLSNPILTICFANGGEGGIRTPGRVATTIDFESITFGHSATSPGFKLLGINNVLSIGKPTMCNQRSMFKKTCRLSGTRYSYCF